MPDYTTVNLQRRYPISSETLFHILTEPPYMERWFSPAPEIDMKVLSHKAEVGAAYEFLYTEPDGTTHSVVGEYCALEKPNLIAFTWGWKEPDPDAGISTLVTMSLKPVGPETELTILHEKLHAGEMADRHAAGWIGTLERLEALISSRTGT